MSTPTDNTKVELVTEAIEYLIAVAVDGQVSKKIGVEAARHHERVVIAREGVATALRDFLKPTLRVVG